MNLSRLACLVALLTVFFCAVVFGLLRLGGIEVSEQATVWILAFIFMVAAILAFYDACEYMKLPENEARVTFKQYWGEFLARVKSYSITVAIYSVGVIFLCYVFGHVGWVSQFDHSGGYFSISEAVEVGLHFYVWTQITAVILALLLCVL